MADIFEFLDKMNKGDLSYLDNLPDEDVKSLSPYVLLMWCSGANTNRPIHAIMTDSYCNDKIFRLYRHPRLLLNLFFAANSDIDRARYSFVKYGSSDKKVITKNIATYLKCGYDEAKDILDVLKNKDDKIEKHLKKFFEVK